MAVSLNFVHKKIVSMEYFDGEATGKTLISLSSRRSNWSTADGSNKSDDDIDEGEDDGASQRRKRNAKKPEDESFSPKKLGDTLKKPGRKKKKRVESFSLYIYKVLKQVHPETGISKKSMHIMNSFILDMFDRMATESIQLMLRQGRKTLGTREMQTACRLVLPGELSKHAVVEGTKAVGKFKV